MTSNTIQVLTDGNFEASVIQASTPVLVDFWAEWCGPCRLVAPTVEALASDFSGRIIVGKLNVDENPLTAGRFGIRSIPTLLVFKEGQVVDSVIGLADKPRLKAVLEEHL